ncbi:MAG TPA: DUF4124 domain-containing protein [Casimicrobiaceae bacterium]|nr:DUF4124 domain-containing protein [Casimicrobiaceae bacterium]
MRSLALIAFVIACAAAAPAHAQTIYKCKAANGRVTYSSQPCANDAEVLSIPGSAPRGAGGGSAQTGAAAGLPRECDNAQQLKWVVTRLDSPDTHDDVREFLADERFRIMRCELTRFSPQELREREAAIAGIDSLDPALRHTAQVRIEEIYDRHLTPSERSGRQPPQSN